MVLIENNKLKYIVNYNIIYIYMNELWRCYKRTIY